MFMKSRIFISIMFLFFISTCQAYEISEIGKKFIQECEGLRLDVYPDGGGYSIGYGHHLLPGEKYEKISKDTAKHLFNKDIKKTNESINRLLKRFEGKYRFSQNFIDGLADLIYNCGEGGVKNSVFYSRLCKCRFKDGKIDTSDYNFTIAAVKNLRVSEPGHVTRRGKVYKMMK